MAWQMPADLTQEQQAWVVANLALAGVDYYAERYRDMDMVTYRLERDQILAAREILTWST